MAAAKKRNQIMQQIRQAQAAHPVWSQAFVEQVRCSQVEEDLFAARTVCGVLIAIVTGGALLGALAVLLATLL